MLAGWLAAFRDHFSAPVWSRVLVLVTGVVLAPGKRTARQALRVMGLAARPGFSRYHEVLNRARWDGRAVARTLLVHVLKAFLPLGEVVVGVDDTIACPSERWSSKRGRRHKTVVDRAHQAVLQAKRWLPNRRLIVVAGAGFSGVGLIAALRRHACLITRLRIDASLRTMPALLGLLSWSQFGPMHWPAPRPVPSVPKLPHGMTSASRHSATPSLRSAASCGVRRVY